MIRFKANTVLQCNILYDCYLTIKTEQSHRTIWIQFHFRFAPFNAFFPAHLASFNVFIICNNPPHNRPKRQKSTLNVKPHKSRYLGSGTFDRRNSISNTNTLKNQLRTHFHLQLNSVTKSVHRHLRCCPVSLTLDIMMPDVVDVTRSFSW